MTWNFLKHPKNRNRNLPLSYGGARRERVLRGRVALIAGASSQRLLLSRLLWVLSCSATRKCPAGGTAQEHGKVFVLGNFLWFSCEGREGALHHETGHVKAAISPLRFAAVEMTLFYTNSNLSLRTGVFLYPFRATISADGIAKRTGTHWQRALPAKHQFILQNRYPTSSVSRGGRC